MSSLAFADTFFYFALVSPRDQAHRRAREVSQRTDTKIVTSAWVIQELADGLSVPPARGGFLRLWSSLQADSNTIIVPASEGLWRLGMALYQSRTDKAWSLTDCISFEIMREQRIQDALTADKHFEQAGFNAILKADS